MALSMDIREKVMKAIASGMSCRQAAARFYIGPATVVRWAKRVETKGDVAPMKMGGDRRSQRIEAHADFILAQIEAQPDLTILELREKIRERHGVGFGYATVWRFLARHNITRKKKTGHAAEQEETMLPRRARRGSRDSSISIRRSSFFSMRRRFRRTWRAASAGLRAASVAECPCRSDGRRRRSWPRCGGIASTRR